jgi:hypothetical protein
VRFFTAASLVNRLEEAQKQYQLDRLLAQLDRTDLLICDELGYLSFNRSARRAPPSPPQASPTARRIFAIRLVFCPYDSATSGNRSVKILCGQNELSQKNLRLRQQIRTGKPCHGRSRSLRS